MSDARASAIEQVRRLRQLAESAAFHQHCEDSHPESFESCVHDDCVLVRESVNLLFSSSTLPPMEKRMSIDTVEAELNEKDEQIYRTLLERACWYRDGCDGLEDTVAYFASGDCARDAARDLETALAEIRMYRQVLDLQRRQSAERLERLK